MESNLLYIYIYTSYLAQLCRHEYAYTIVFVSLTSGPWIDVETVAKWMKNSSASSVVEWLDLSCLVLAEDSKTDKSTENYWVVFDQESGATHWHLNEFCLPTSISCSLTCGGAQDMAMIGIPCPIFSRLNEKTRKRGWNPFREPLVSVSGCHGSYPLDWAVGSGILTWCRHRHGMCHVLRCEMWFVAQHVTCVIDIHVDK